MKVKPVENAKVSMTVQKFNKNCSLKHMLPNQITCHASTPLHTSLQTGYSI